MQIRNGTAEELLKLWGYQDVNIATPTAKFFYSNLSVGNAIFWTLDNDGELIGELYVFLDLEDKDFADGDKRAYLCAFRVKKEHRGHGFGSSLMKKALVDLKERGFRNATIGVENDELDNIRLYRHLGFNTKIKDCHYDPCGLDELMQPVYAENSWWLLLKDL